MSVAIRLQRGGRTKLPFYTIVVTDSRSGRDSRFIERLGHYNPLARGQDVPFAIDMAKFDGWIAKGAQPSSTVARLLIKNGKAPAAVEAAEKARKAKRIKAQESVAAFNAKREAAKAAKEGAATAAADKEAADKAAAEAKAAEDAAKAAAAEAAAAAAPAEAPAEAAAPEAAPAEEPKAE